jgi:hypothetical protein
MSMSYQYAYFPHQCLFSIGFIANIFGAAPAHLLPNAFPFWRAALDALYCPIQILLDSSPIVFVAVVKNYFQLVVPSLVVRTVRLGFGLSCLYRIQYCPAGELLQRAAIRSSHLFDELKLFVCNSRLDVAGSKGVTIIRTHAFSS